MIHLLKFHGDATISTDTLKDSEYQLVIKKRNAYSVVRKSIREILGGFRWGVHLKKIWKR